MNPAVCKHDIKFKDMCATCGKDLRINNSNNTLASITPPTARVSMVHHVPELVVSKDLANELGAKEYEQVLKARKLILLVDLDQTLIHTTNRLLKKYESRNDLFRFRCQDGFYFTKLRPHTREFLENMHRLYDMHIISFGQRYYAHKIAKFLDPDGKFFGHRIMSRDELTSGRHKTNNIPALFPCADQRKLIVIIDDRDDVWEYSESLVRIRPYKFFSEVDDINAPPTAPRGSVKKLEAEEVAEGKEPDEGSKAEVEKREATPPPPPSTSSPTIPEDSDNVLEDVERVLTEVHRAFFEHYDKTKEVTDVSAIVSYMRKQVLKNEIICLSGIVPINYPKKRSLVFRLCEQFGATVVDNIDEKTTVLIAARPSTEKVRLAIKRNIPVCTPEWIFTCTAKWLNVPKKDFAHHGLDIKHFREHRATGNQSPKLSDLEPLSKEEMKSMTDEIDAELGETSSSESENEAEDDEKGSDTEAEGETEESGQPVEEIKEQVEEPASEGDLEANKVLLAKLKAGAGDTDEEEEIDEELRNGEIDSRKRRRRSESAEFDVEPPTKKFSADHYDDEIGGEDEGGSGDDSEDEMAAAIERQL